MSTLSLLIWPLFIASPLNIGGWSYLPGAEARGTLGTVPIGLGATLYPLSDICLIVSSSTSHFSLSISILSYPTLHFSLITTFPFTSRSPLLHAPLLSPGYPGQADPIIAWIGAVLDSAPLIDTSP